MSDLPQHKQPEKERKVRKYINMCVLYIKIGLGFSIHCYPLARIKAPPRLRGKTSTSTRPFRMILTFALTVVAVALAAVGCVRFGNIAGDPWGKCVLNDAVGVVTAVLTATFMAYKVS
ncbi:hypothetical protein DFH27DRAFT_651178 [Peziza echinospora]|nr:hypothetical protein DFH27DRAFT_651178 [Peziza echinospora]